MRRRTAAEDLPSWLAATHGIVAVHLQRIGVPIAGLPFVRIHERGTSLEVEAGYPVTERITPKGEVRPATIPGGPNVIVRSLGDLEVLDEVLEAADAWMQQRGVEPDGAPLVTGFGAPDDSGDGPTMLEVRHLYLD